MASNRCNGSQFDLVLVSQDSEVSVSCHRHKIILTSAHVMRSLMGFREEPWVCLTVPVPGQVLLALVDFAYGHPKPFCDESAKDFLVGALDLDCHEAALAAEGFLADRVVAPDNCLDLMGLAHARSLGKLLESCRKCFYTDPERACDNGSLEDMDFGALRGLLADEAASCPEEDLLVAGLAWHDADPVNRRSSLVALLGNVRLHLLPEAALGALGKDPVLERCAGVRRLLFSAKTWKEVEPHDRCYSEHYSPRPGNFARDWVLAVGGPIGGPAKVMAHRASEGEGSGRTLCETHRLHNPSLCVAFNCLYAVEGAGSFHRYDPLHDKWADLSPTAEGCSRLTALGPELLVATGGGHERAYHVGDGRWRDLPEAPWRAGEHAAAAVGGFLYVVAADGRCRRYEDRTDRWEDAPRAPPAEGAEMTAAGDRLCRFWIRKGTLCAGMFHLGSWADAPAAECRWTAVLGALPVEDGKVMVLGRDASGGAHVTFDPERASWGAETQGDPLATVWKVAGGAFAVMAKKI